MAAAVASVEDSFLSPTQFEPLPNCFKGTGLSGLPTMTVTYSEFQTKPSLI